MTHDELLAEINERIEELHDAEVCDGFIHALRAVVEFHIPRDNTNQQDGTDLRCRECTDGFEPYPCPTIQIIEKELA